MPAAFYEQPEIWPHLQCHWDTFHDLTTERQIGMGLGPIPVSMIKAYARDELDLGGDAADRFVSIIRLMDDEYREAANPQPADAKDKRLRLEVSPDDSGGVKNLLNRLGEQNKKPGGPKDKEKTRKP